MVSVIVPVYNVAAYLDRCFQSLERQTLTDIEIIVVNDGSTDNSQELCVKYTSKHNNWHYFNKENGGLMSAWMEGVSHASGDYFGFVDSDDYVDDVMFEKLYAKAKEYDADIVMCERYDVKGGNTQVTSSCIKPGFYSGDDMHEIYKNIMPKFSGEHITNSRWNKLFRREVFLNNIKYCECRSRICEDRFITPACMFNAKSFYYLNEPLYYYVLRAGSNHSMPSEKLQDAMELLHEMQKRMIYDYAMESKYGEEIDRANLNYIRLMMNRNFSSKGNLRKKIQLARRIALSKTYQDNVSKHENDLKGKAGFLVKLLVKYKAYRLFAIIVNI